MRWNIVGAIGILLLVSCGVWAGQEGSKPERLSLLNGRLSAEFPASARNTSGDGRDIGTTGAATDEETTIVANLNPREALVVLCNELFLDAGRDFAGNARRYVAQLPAASGHFVVDTVIRKPHLSAVTFLPDKVDTERPSEAVFLKGALIRNRDGTVQQMLFYAPNIELAQHLSDYRRSIHGIVASLQPGKRRLNRAARTISLGKSDYDKTIQDFVQISLPKNWVLTLRLRASASPFRSGMTPQDGADELTVFGCIPDPFYHIQKIEQLGSLSGRDDDVPRFQREIAVKCPQRADLFLHIYLCAATEAEHRELDSLAGTMRLLKTKAAK